VPVCGCVRHRRTVGVFLYFAFEIYNLSTNVVCLWMYLSLPFCTPRVALSEIGEFLLRLVPVDKTLF